MRKSNPIKYAYLESIPLLSFEPGGVFNLDTVPSDYSLTIITYNGTVFKKNYFDLIVMLKFIVLNFVVFSYILHKHRRVLFFLVPVVRKYMF